MYQNRTSNFLIRTAGILGLITCVAACIVLGLEDAKAWIILPSIGIFISLYLLVVRNFSVPTMFGLGIAMIFTFASLGGIIMIIAYVNVINGQQIAALEEEKQALEDRIFILEEKLKNEG